MKAKIVKLPKAESALKGMIVSKEKYGNVGAEVESVMQDIGYRVSQENEPDLKEIGVEVKTRNTSSRSAHTVASMSISNIIATSYKQSPIFDKFQTQFRVKHDQTFYEVTDAKIYDFTDPAIQKSLENSYEAGRELFRQIKDRDVVAPNYIRGDNCECYWERKVGDTYAFRIPNGTMKKFETISAVRKNFNNLFE